MSSNYFEWETFHKDYPSAEFPIDSMGEIFLVLPKERNIWFSKACANLVFGHDKNSHHTKLTYDEIGDYFSEESVTIIRQEISRLQEGYIKTINTHISIKQDYANLSAVAHIYKIQEVDALFGFLYVDYEPIKEYEKQLNDTIQQLKRAQDINELILEGSADYIYQLDVVNDVCTFSSKATEVLNLDTPTFNNAMNRILGFIIPEDRSVFLNSYTPFFTGKSQYHTAEYRCITRSGDIIWISCRGKGMHDENGRPLLIAGSLMDITEQKKNESRISEMIYVDELTGLGNQRKFSSDISDILKDKNAKGSLYYVNIRKFKVFNELFGQQFGDRVLQEFAKMLQLYFYDAAAIYHISGDEFLIHMNLTDQDAIRADLAPFLHTLTMEQQIDGRRIYISVYIAVLTYPVDGSSVEELINNANKCLYRLSREEYNGVFFFSGTKGDDLTRMFNLETALRNDIQNNYQNFRVVYQPIVKLEDGNARWVGGEALLRYSNALFADVKHMEVIHTLEYAGLFVEVGRWVVKQAAKACASWRKYMPEASVHVNVAAQQIADPGFVDFVEKVCQQEGIDNSSMQLELTETSLIKNLELTALFCNDLLGRGFGIALDDFGSGYAGFQYLRNLPITQIKIDRAYSTRIHEDNYNQVVVKFLYELAKDKALELLAEGVETREELDMYKQLGINLIQGFYFEKPLEEDTFLAECAQKSKSLSE